MKKAKTNLRVSCLVSVLALVGACNNGVDPVSSLESSQQAFVQWEFLGDEDLAPATAFDPINHRAFVVWADRSNASSTQSDIFGRFFNLDGTPTSGKLVLSSNVADDLAPHVAFGGGKFLVAFARTTSSGSSDVAGSLVDAASQTIVREVSLESTATSYGQPRVVFINKLNKFMAIYVGRQDSTGRGVLASTYFDPNNAAGAGPFVQVLRTSGIRYPGIAYSPESDKLAVVWGSVTSEDIELMTWTPQSAMSPFAFQIPNRTTWSKDGCLELACLRTGDTASVAYNPATRRFGLTISNQLSLANLHAYSFADTCDSNNCAQVTIVNRSTPPFDCCLLNPGRLDSQMISLAATGPNFSTSYNFNEGGSAITQLQASTYSSTSNQVVFHQPIVANPPADQKHFMGPGASASLATRGSPSTESYMVFRRRLPNNAQDTIRLTRLGSDGIRLSEFVVEPR
jgi:hypothetical protein